MCLSKVQHVTGRKTGCNRSRPIFFGFSIFRQTSQLATKKIQNLCNRNQWSGLLQLGSVRFWSFFQSSELDLQTLPMLLASPQIPTICNCPVVFVVSWFVGVYSCLDSCVMAGWWSGCQMNKATQVLTFDNFLTFITTLSRLINMKHQLSVAYPSVPHAPAPCASVHVLDLIVGSLHTHYCCLTHLLVCCFNVL